MNGKKARKLRKSLGMTRENHVQKDNKGVKHGKKPVYFRDKYGNLLPPQMVERYTVVNTNLYYYRKAKKQITNNLIEVDYE